MNLDPDMPLHDEGIYSHSAGKTTWFDVPPEELRTMLEGGKAPFFRTVLARTGDNSYAGPFYLDIDHLDNISWSIEDLHELLSKLEKAGLDLESVRLFATGGKGFHLEVPAACFMPRVKAIEGLPIIYRTMAHQFHVEGLDYRVYSCGRGRMWRTPNLKRDNGKYKVPITLDEARSITPEKYAELTSAPRNFPSLKAPVFCKGFAVAFSEARRQALSPPIRKKTPEKLNAELNKRFTARGYPLPLSLMLLATGKTSARQGVGWNQICVQLATVAHAMGTSADDLVKVCRNLLANHVGDSRRYHSPALREKELRSAYSATGGNAAYDFSVAGIKSILPKSSRCNDLEGL